MALLIDMGCATFVQPLLLTNLYAEILEILKLPECLLISGVNAKAGLDECLDNVSRYRSGVRF